MYAALRRDEPVQAAALAAKLAAAGDAEAQFTLGVLLDAGAGVRIDHKAAAHWVQTAARHYPPAVRYLAWRGKTDFDGSEPAAQAGDLRPGIFTREPNLDPGLRRWMDYREGQLMPNFARAFLWMSEHAQAGEVVAQANLAEASFSTLWTTPNLQEHLDWLRMAAYQKDAASAERLATYYELGLGVKADPAQALKHRKLAAEGGSVDAQLKLAEIYLEGDGVTADHAVGVGWLQRAAAQNNPEAMLKLAGMAADNTAGRTPDYAEALRLGRAAAALGDAGAMTFVANMMREGQGTPRDLAGAARLFEQAAEKGFIYAAYVRGWMRLQGELGPADYADARHWFEQAAAGDSELAMMALAKMYGEGLGVARDDAKTFEWLERAAREGNAEAQMQVGVRLQKGVGIEADDEEAVNWFRLAADSGNALGEANLGSHYLLGRGVAQDNVLALQHLAKALHDVSDNWVQGNFYQAVAKAPEGQKAAVEAIFQQCLADPGLLNMPGALPEVCLTVLEHRRDKVSHGAAAKLLTAMLETHRAQSLPAVAWHLYLGQFLPCDIARARSLAQEAAGQGARAGTIMVAVIDSVTAATAEARVAALRTLREQADAGDQRAQIVAASRILGGLDETGTVEQARRYLRQAYGEGKKLPAYLESLLKSPLAPPPTEEALAALQAQAGVKQTDPQSATPVRVFACAPVYPLELRYAEVEGMARIEFVVDLRGRPTNVRATDSTHPVFAAHAEATLRRWRFTPGLRDGQPAAYNFVQPLFFKLND